MNAKDRAVEIQRKYYAQTAQNYDNLHQNDPEHQLALYLMAAYIKYYGIKSVLDVGAGTGDSILWLKQHFPELKVTGIEPVSELREQGYKKGLSKSELLEGDVYQLSFEPNSFDLVCEFAVLHHVENPDIAVQEMSKIARKMICISDSNFLGQGTLLNRWIKLLLFVSGLWSLANWLKTGGKGYYISEEDGLAYSYSVFQNFPYLQKKWETVRYMTTKGEDLKYSSLLTADHLMLIGINKKH
ncbi:Methyltransferase type 11 [Halothece sp. PCC 7418]|uniref:class I SAM-dependent methyltransferase n=1 Tax=Halothece sp. (strain PCC 7418) TaxID=65093 RepID=UPI0002A05CBB|nr:class I SAM-dependent methyltransferase [Halothece sp. PCC 7418]AFZ44933.1 Methyltransferase type 11 [Halothece sp. PCC 7418]